MRKLFVTLCAVAMLAFGAVAFAQDEPVTIAEIVVAATESETPEFTSLLGAVGAADPAVLEALSDPEAELTVFAPTDAAFEAFAAALIETYGEEGATELATDPDVLTSILLYHVLDGVVTSEDLVALFEEEGDSDISVQTILGQTAIITALEDGGLMIDNANIVLEMVDIEASNGVIHVIDAVLVPELRTIAEIVVASTEAETPEFTALLAAVSAADPSVLEALSDSESELTVFAPTDEAFAALGEETLTAVLGDVDMVTAILTYHVLDGVFTYDDVATALEEAGEDGLVIETLNGVEVTVTADDEGLLYINEAQIVIADVDAINGIIHVINAVLVPATE